MKRALGNMILTIFLLAGGTALAQDTIGVFFDSEGLTTDTVTTALNGVTEAWLLLLDPSLSTGVSGWECEIQAQTEGPQPIMNWSVAGGGTNLGTAPVFIVGLPSPLLSADAVVLATAMILVPDPGHEVALAILPYNSPSLSDPPDTGYPVQRPAYVSGPSGTLHALEPASGCVNLPVAHINNDGIDTGAQLSGVPNELYFGTRNAGGSATLNFRVYNRGSTPLFGEARIAMTGCLYRHGGGYFTDAPTTFRVNPGANLEFGLFFTLPTTGFVTGQMTVSVCDQEYVVNLFSGARECDVSTSAIDFGEVSVGSVTQRNVRMTNVGGYEIDATPGLDPACESFTWTQLTGGDPAHLGPGEIIDVAVIYQPKDENHHLCTLSFGEGACSDVALQGTALIVPPVCSISSALQFGSVATDSTRIRSLYLRNTGGGHLVGEIQLVDSIGAFSIVSGGGVFDLTGSQIRDIVVAFTPTAPGSFSAQLDLGTECSAVNLLGDGVVGDPSYVLYPIDFGILQTGGSTANLLTIRNTGVVSIAGDLQISGDSSFTLSWTGPFTLAPGALVDLGEVWWEPTAYGPATAEVSIGVPGGSNGLCRGFGVETTPARGRNELGLYFDPDFTLDNPRVDPGTTLPGYLVVTGPTAPIGGWEVGILFAGDAYAQAWSFSGTASGELGPSRFQVALASPLPPASSVVLATTDITVPTDGATIIIASGLPDGEVPGYGSYVDGDQPANHLPLWQTSDGVLGTINEQSPVAVDAPATPVAEVTGGEVLLTWSCDIGPIAGYNVYRRLGEAAPTRLNSTPVVCNEGQGLFRDQPQGAAGTVVAYSVTRLVEAVESGPSVAAEITLQGSSIPLRTRLLASYPNPFNPQTTVPFEMARPGHARLAVYDAGGKLVRVLADADFEAGHEDRVWYGRDTNGLRVPSGVYYLRLETESNVELGKILLLK